MTLAVAMENFTWHRHWAHQFIGESGNKSNGELGREPMPHPQVRQSCHEYQTLPTKEVAIGSVIVFGTALAMDWTR